MTNKLVNSAEAARMKGLPYTTFIKILDRGEGPPPYHASNLRLFKRSDVEAWEVPTPRRSSRPVPRELTWKPHFDDVLAEFHGQGLTDIEITNRMLDRELDVSSTDVGTARRRLGLAANKRPQPKVVSLQPRPPARIVDPLEQAKTHLPGFCRLTMTILENGRRYPIKLQVAIRRTNEILKAKGEQQVGPKELWV
jgi:hypothetical protein